MSHDAPLALRRRTWFALPEMIEAAFFDVDNTLLDVKSMFAFQEHWYGPEGYAAFLDRLRRGIDPHDRLALNRRYYADFAGRTPAETRAAAEEWFAGLRTDPGSTLWIASACELLASVKARGAVTVAVSGSSEEILAPIADALGIDAILATRLVVEDGRYTGEIAGRQMLGTGKADAIREFAETRDIDLGLCLACGDHETDLPMLRAVGHAFVVAGDRALEQVADANGWPLLAPNGPSASVALPHA